jgi:hypothetical protein
MVENLEILHWITLNKPGGSGTGISISFYTYLLEYANEF